MRKHSTISLIAAAGLALALAVPAAAWAANYNVSGTLFSNGSLTQYGTFRPHSTGPAGLNVTRNVVGAAGSSFGLRATSGVQVTTSRTWDSTFGLTGYKPFASATTLLPTIPGGSLAVNGRILGCCDPSSYNISWAGILTQ